MDLHKNTLILLSGTQDEMYWKSAKFGLPESTERKDNKNRRIVTIDETAPDKITVSDDRVYKDGDEAETLDHWGNITYGTIKKYQDRQKNIFDIVCEYMSETNITIVLVSRPSIREQVNIRANLTWANGSIEIKTD